MKFSWQQLSPASRFIIFYLFGIPLALFCFGDMPDSLAAWALVLLAPVIYLISSVWLASRVYPAVYRNLQRRAAITASIFIVISLALVAAAVPIVYRHYGWDVRFANVISLLWIGSTSGWAIIFSKKYETQAGAPSPL